MRNAQTEAKRLPLPEYSDRWAWEIYMDDSRTLAPMIELAKYGHFCTQKWLVILYVLAKGREKSSRQKKRKGMSFI